MYVCILVSKALSLYPYAFLLIATNLGQIGFVSNKLVGRKTKFLVWVLQKIYFQFMNSYFEIIMLKNAGYQ